MGKEQEQGAIIRELVSFFNEGMKEKENGERTRTGGGCAALPLRRRSETNFASSSRALRTLR